jgi:hypothetical protein
MVRKQSRNCQLLNLTIFQADSTSKRPYLQKDSSSIARSNFKLNEVTRKFDCNHCKSSLASDHSGNLKKHLKTHPEIYQLVLDAEVKEAAERDRSKKARICDVDERSKKREVNLYMSQKDLIDSLVELCTVNGRPLCIVEDSGLKQLISPLADSLGITVNRQNMRDFIRDTACDIRTEVAKELSGRIFYLKADSATRLHRSILGINCQYYCAKIQKLKIATLAMTEVKISSTADNIKDFVVETLKKYKLNLKFCKGWTTDNGSNYVKTGKILEVLQALGDDDEDFDFKSIEYLDKPAFVKAKYNVGLILCNWEFRSSWKVQFLRFYYKHQVMQQKH